MAKDRFDAEAAGWDNNPTTVKSSKLAFGALSVHVPSLTGETHDIDVLEIGCGTGLLSLLVAPHVRSLTAVDPSAGMISVLKSKLSTHNIQNVKPVCVLLQDPDDIHLRVSPDSAPMRFDLVLSHLVLHHVPSLPDMLATMHGCLKPGGSVALTDFENFGPDARKFHPESKMEGVERHGITKDEMSKLLVDAGFKDVRVQEAFRLDKTVEGGKEMSFPFLICQGIR